LLRWESWIGGQPVTVLTDHQALTHWHDELWNSPAGPAGRRGRWHEIFSRFDLTVEYQPGAAAKVPDALSRWAYPAGQSAECSKHGSMADKADVRAMEAEERLREDRELNAQWSAMPSLIDKDDEEELALSAMLGLINRPDHETERLSACVAEEMPSQTEMQRGVQELWERCDPEEFLFALDIPLCSMNAHEFMPQDAFAEVDETNEEAPSDDDAEPDEDRGSMSARIHEWTASRNAMAPSECAALQLQDDSGNDLHLEEHETVSAANWQRHYKKDPEMWDLYVKVAINNVPVRGILWHHGRLWKHDRIVVPPHLRGCVVWETHNLLHRIVRAVRVAVLRRFDIPSTTVEEFSRKTREGCPVCQMMAPPNRRPPGDLSMYRIPSQVMQAVVIDMVSLPEVQWAGRTYDSLLVTADRLSGYILALPHQKLGSTGKALAQQYVREIVPHFGLPASLTTAWDAPLVSSFWRSLCAQMGINHRTVQAFNPQANGRAERAVAQVIAALRLIIQKWRRANWMEVLPIALYTLNASPGDDGFSPYEIVHGRVPILIGEQAHLRENKPDVQAHEFFARQLQMQNRVRERLEARHQRVMERDLATRPAKAEAYRVDDQVWWRWSAVAARKADANKLSPRWHGPCRIDLVRGADQYTIQFTETGRRKEVSVQELKPVRPPFKGPPLPLYATSIPRVTAHIPKGPITIS
jgi:hypothetical protein